MNDLVMLDLLPTTPVVNVVDTMEADVVAPRRPPATATAGTVITTTSRWNHSPTST